MFVNGLATGGRVITGYTYFNELYPDRTTSVVGTVWNICEGMVNVGIAIYYLYISSDWRWLILYAAASNLLAFLISAYLLPESPKWLYSQDKFAECAKVLLYIGKFNGKSDMHTLNALSRSEEVKGMSQVIGLQKESVQTGDDLIKEEKENKSVLREIFKDQMMARNFLGMMCVWVSSAFGYYLISFQLKYIKGDFFVNNITAAGSEVVSYFTSGLIFRTFGLKATFISSYVLAIAGMVSLMMVNTSH